MNNMAEEVEEEGEDTQERLVSELNSNLEGN